MIVSVVLNTEYMADEERIKWFLKNVSFAQKEDCVIITHECLHKQLRELIDNCQDRFYAEFEMDRTSFEEIENMDICYLPDEIFEKIYSRKRSRTRTILDLLYERNFEIEKIVKTFIDGCLERRGEDKPDYILNCLHTPASLKSISECYDAPIVPYVFSCLRKVHGYQQTLYMAHIDEDLFVSNAAYELYSSFVPESLPYKPLNKKEILALLGKQHNLPLFPLMEREGKYDFGVCGEGFHIIPNTYEEAHVTDDDLYFEINRVIPNAKIVSRLHPIQMDQSGFGRKHMKNDPAAFILSSKRITTVQSQMIVKAAMWNRPICILGNCLPFSFMFEKDFSSEKKVSDEDLNFLIFAYFVPNSCMFNREYWIWRMSKPSANELYKHHLEVIFDELGIGSENINCDNRIELILRNRGCTEREIVRILGNYESQLIRYNYITSKAILEGDVRRDIYSLNRFADDVIYSTFEVENAKKYTRVKFNLPNDLDAFITILKCSIDGTPVAVDSKRQYWKKGACDFSIPLDAVTDTLTIQIEWVAQNYFDAFE